MDISDFQTIRVKLCDMGPVGGPKTEVKVSISPAAISLYPEGVEREGGVNPPILLYVYGGVVRLCIWSDPGSEQPTHVVAFDGVRTSYPSHQKPFTPDRWDLD